MNKNLKVSGELHTRVMQMKLDLKSKSVDQLLNALMNSVPSDLSDIKARLENEKNKN